MYTFVYFNSTLDIFQKYIFIEMLDKLDTVCLSRELAALLLVAIATRIDSGLHNRPDMIQSLVLTHYIMQQCQSTVSSVP